MGAGGDSRLFTAGGCQLFPLEEGFGEPWFPKLSVQKDITDLLFDAVVRIWASACARLARWRCPGAGSCVR